MGRGWESKWVREDGSDMIGVREERASQPPANEGGEVGAG